MNNGRGGWLISSHARSNLPAEARSAGRSTFQASCRLFSFYLSVFLLFWLPITEVCRVLNLTIANSAKRLCVARVRSPRTPTYFRGLYHDIGRAHTSCTHFNWIFELMSSLRSNYALCSDTMPLTSTLYSMVTYFKIKLLTGSTNIE